MAADDFGVATEPSVAAGARSIQPGRRIGKYEILQHLATGGMAEVYLARVTGIEQFQKLCVIKRILPAAAGGLADQCVGAAGSDGGVGDGNVDVEPHALGTWTTATAMPVGRYTFASATNGAHFYVIGGIEGTTGHSDVWVANVNTAAIEPRLAITSWAQLTSLPLVAGEQTANRWTFGATYYASYLYVFGGRSDGTNFGNTPDVLAAPVNADGTIGSWTATTPLPEGLKCHAVASSGSHVYLIGGKNSGTAKAFVLHAEMSAGSVSTWTNVAMLDTTVFNHAAVAANGYLYVIGGCLSGNNVCDQLLDIVEVAKINSDGSLGPFVHGPALPVPRSHHTAVVDATNSDLYVIGGKYGAHNADPPTAAVIAAHLYPDGTVGPWRAMTPLPNGNTRAASTVIGSYLLYVRTDSQIVPIQ